MTTYTSEEFEEFKWIVDAGMSKNSFEKLIYDVEMPKFLEKVGREKWDAMFDRVLAESKEAK